MKLLNRIIGIEALAFGLGIAIALCDSEIRSHLFARGIASTQGLIEIMQIGTLCCGLATLILFMIWIFRR